MEEKYKKNSEREVREEMIFSAEKFCRILTEKQLNIEEVSKKTGVGSNSISRYKRGIHKPGLKNLGKLAKGLEVTIDELVDVT